MTGGLGGLGLRAAALLAERGAPSIVLASRSGRIARDGQGLHLFAAAVELVAFDSSSASDMNHLLCATSPVGLWQILATANTDGLVASMHSRKSWASNQTGAHIFCASTTAPQESRAILLPGI